MKHTIACLLLCAAVARAQIPADFGDTFARLAALADREDRGAIEMARGLYDAARFIAIGEPGLDWIQPRFREASSFGEAAVAGLYLTTWGGSAQLAAIRKELERNPQKRKWLHTLVGSEEAFRAHLTAGGRYRPLIRLLPDVGGARALTMQLMRSRDPLVRRAGLYWGFWVADENYWTAVRSLARTEKDRTTLRLAQELLRRKNKD